jgi:transposase
MAKNTRFVGLDVHAETISVAVAEGRNQVRSLGTIANRLEAVRRLLGKLGKLTELRVCYEAGPTGYALHWELTRLGVQCEVIAPSLVPMKSNDLKSQQSVTSALPALQVRRILRSRSASRPPNVSGLSSAGRA